MTRYAAKELRGMNLQVLAEIGGDLGLTFTKNHTKAERAKRILAAYAERDVASSPGSASPVSTLADPFTAEPSPEFEQLIDNERIEAEALHTQPQRGGSRPGAGRPPGMTEEIAFYNRLSEQPHPAIKMVIEDLFDSWAKKVGSKSILPDKEKMVALALSWTHVYEISPIRGMIPPWAAVLLTCLWTTRLVIRDTAQAARDFRQRKIDTALAPPQPIEAEFAHG